MSLLTRLFSKRKEKSDDLPPEFLQELPPDWFIELKGRGPSGEKPFSVRIQLFAARRGGTAEILILPASPGEQPKGANIELSRTEIDRLLLILGFSFPQDIADSDGAAEDGMPVNIVIYRREPFLPASARCNLAGRLDSRTQMPPGAEIGKLAVEILRRALPGI